MAQAEDTIDPGRGLDPDLKNVAEDATEDHEHAPGADLRIGHIEIHETRSLEKTDVQSPRKNLDLDLQRDNPDRNPKRQRIQMEGIKVMHVVLVEINDLNQKKNHL